MAIHADLKDMKKVLFDTQHWVDEVSKIWTDSAAREFLGGHVPPALDLIHNYLTYAERLLEEVEHAERRL